MSDDLLLRLPERVETAPGHPTTVPAGIANNGATDVELVVQLVGVDPDWTEGAQRIPLPGGAEVAVELPVTVPVATPAGAYTAALVVQPIDPVTQQATGPATYADVALVVGTASQITAALLPPEPTGVTGRRLELVLTNRSPQQADVEVTTTAPPGLSVRFRRRRVSVPAGEQRVVRGRVAAPRRLVGGTRRIPFLLTVQGRTVPMQVESAFVQRPLFNAAVTRACAMALVVALWLVAGVVGIGKVGSMVRSQQAKQVAAQQDAGADGEQDGAGDGEGDGDAGAGGQGTTKTVSTKPPGRIGGQITGAAPGGVRVRMRPTSLVDEAAQGATPVGVAARAVTTTLGKARVQLAGYALAGRVLPTRETRSSSDGGWAFAAVPSPGYYLLEFSKAGYQTRRYVVAAPTAEEPVQLEVPLKPGRGRLAGRVLGGTAPLGGVDLTITDGTVTVRSSTSTTAGGGQWSVDGLSTPGSYLVTAARRGYGSESRLVTLAAGGVVDDVALTLKAGVGSIAGTVSSPEGPLGGATVRVTDGTTTREATTVTEGAVGSFAVPQLPLGRSYLVTVTGDGWAPRTQRVDLTGNAIVNATLRATSSTVSGTVRAVGGGPALDGAGLVLTGEAGTFKTLSLLEPLGGYAFTGVPPGSYLLTAQLFGRLPTTAAVEVASGELRTVDLELAPAPGGGLPTTAQVRGQVVDLRTGGPITCPAKLPACVVTVKDAESGLSVTVPPGQDYLLPATVDGDKGLAPGLHHITVSAVGYEPITLSVAVASAAVTIAPVAALPAATAITGTITSSVDGVPAGTCVVVVPWTSSGPGTAPTCATTPEGGSSGVVAADGRYAAEGLLHGSYRIWVVPGGTTGPGGRSEYQTIGPVETTIEIGRAQRFDATLNRLGRVRVAVKKPGSSGALVAAPDIDVTLSTTPPTVVRTGPDGIALFTGLEPGTYTAVVPGSGGIATAQSSPLTVGLNATVQSVLVLVPHLGDVQGQVVWQRNGTDLPVPGAQVTAGGTVGYDADPSAPSGLRPRHAEVTVTADSTGHFLVPASLLPLAVPKVDLEVSADGFRTSSQVDLALIPSFTVRLDPLGTPVRGSVALSPTSSTADLDDVAITVVKSAPGAGVVAVDVRSDGSIVWTDSLQDSVGLARPGDYTLRATLAGYDDTTVVVTIGNTPTVTQVLAPIVLRAHGDLVFIARDDAGNPVLGARYVLTSQVNNAPITITAPPGIDRVTFTDLSAAAAPYDIEVRAAGYDVGSRVITTITSGGVQTETVVLARLGAIAGTVIGQVPGSSSTPLSGVRVTATPSGITGATAVSTFTDAGGRYRITGTPENPGLAAGSWVVTATVAGYDPLSPATVVVAAGADTLLDLTLTASVVTLTVNVQSDATPPEPIKNATVYVANASQPLRTERNSSTGAYVFTGLVPTQYSVTVNAPNFASLTIGVSLSIGQPNQAVTVTLASRVNTVTGTVSGSRAGLVEVLDGVLVSAALSATPTVAIDTDTTDAQGAYGPMSLYDGDYTFTFSKAGYQTVTRTLRLSGGQLTQLDATLLAVTRQVVVTVASAVPNRSVAGALVELVAAPSGTGVSQAPQAAASSSSGFTASTTFNQVLAGAYTVRTTGPGAHIAGSSPLTVDTTATTPVATTVTLHEARIGITITSQGTATTAQVTVTTGSGGGATTVATATISGSGEVYVPATTTADNYTVTATATGYDSDPVVLSLVEGDDEAAALTLVQQAGLHVKVQTSTGTPYDGAQIQVTKGPTTLSCTTPGSGSPSGQCDFFGLKAGTYGISMTSTAGSGSTSRKLDAGEDATVTFTLPVSATGTVTIG